MRLLFVHQNFPGQYRHLAAHYAAQPGCEVVAVGEGKNLRGSQPIPGLRKLAYDMPALDGAHSVDAASLTGAAEARLRVALARGRCVAAGAAQLARSGFRPDVVLAHLGWGEGIFLKDVFPQAKLLLYCEFFYRARGSDVGFDPEFPAHPDTALRTRVLNAPLLMALDASDWGMAPTEWQRRQFSAAHVPRISRIHDGIDTDRVAPRQDGAFRLADGRVLRRTDEVVSYVSRNLEPYRGFHRFMRAIPDIQRRRPRAQIVIVGGGDVSYSPRLPGGEFYRNRLLKELEGRIDLSRVHFTERIPYPDYLQLLAVSSAHVYLTVPFVLSWSLLEAMAAGCLIVGSRTPPVEEAITDGENGLLVDYFSAEELAGRVCEALENPAGMQALRERARASIVERYDLRRVCLPRQLELVGRLAGADRIAA